MEQGVYLLVQRLSGGRKLNLFTLAHKKPETQFSLQVLHMQSNG